MPVPSMSQSPSKANGFDMKRRKNSQKKGPAALQREKANRRRGEAQKMQALDEAARDFVRSSIIFMLCYDQLYKIGYNELHFILFGSPYLGGDKKRSS
jgi:hypothetical protein